MDSTSSQESSNPKPSAAVVRQQRRLNDLAGNSGNNRNDFSGWVNDNFAVLRRSTLAIAVVGAAAAILASPRVRVLHTLCAVDRHG
jgi:hypothetical protein